MIERQIEALIRKRMNEYPAVSVYGPRQCGKTTLLRNMFPDFSYANLEDANTRIVAMQDQKAFFENFPAPVIIDEIQNVPSLIGTIQAKIDSDRENNGRFIITGSGQMLLRKTLVQSLAGRTAVINMLPLSLQELSNAGITLERDTQLFTGLMPHIFKAKGTSVSSYYETYIQIALMKDMLYEGSVTDIPAFTTFLTLLALRTGSLTNYAALADDAKISGMTAKKWINLLEAAGIIFRLPPYYTSKTSQIVKTPKIFFTDPGVAAYLVGLRRPEDVRGSRFQGALFENLVVLEALKAIQNTGADGKLFFYRNSHGQNQEVDLVHQIGGVLELYEIKSGAAIDKSNHRGMLSFAAKYGESPMAVINSGQELKSFLGVEYINYMNAGKRFERRQDEFRLQF